jgi:Flp pilus assembly pilin Flp
MMQRRVNLAQFAVRFNLEPIEMAWLIGRPGRQRHPLARLLPCEESRLARRMARYFGGRPPLPGSRRLVPADGVVEYGLLMAAIAVVILVGLYAFGHLVEPWFAGLTGHLTTTGT